jgi:hypothetical protein
MYWMPGYWTQTSAGYQWVVGLWAPVSNTEIEYLPPPPALTIEESPDPALSQNRIWVPPCWYWNNEQYLLRSGYWITAQPDWVWVPSHYVWTPRGYVFAAGHWDYSLNRRGVLFAPVYFPRHIYERRGYSYPLSIIINIDNLQLDLFSRPQYSHYYFGDYYDSSYINIGIFPWFQFEQRRTWYDPIYTHARWRHHHDEPQWEQHQRREYDRRRSDVQLRPPRTYHEMKNRVNHMSAPQRRDVEIAVPITQVVNLKRSPFTFEQNSPKGRAQLSKDSGKIRKFVKERRQWESKGPGRKVKQPDMKGAPSARTNTKMKAPEKPRELERRSSERMKTPTAEHKDRVAEPGRVWQGKGSIKAPQQQQSKNTSPREIERKQVDRVEVRTPPVVDRQRDASHRNELPSWPAEEMNTPVKQKGSKVKPSKQIKSAHEERKWQGTAPGKGGKGSKNVPPQETERDQMDRGEVLPPPLDDSKENRSEKGHGKRGDHR